MFLPIEMSTRFELHREYAQLLDEYQQRAKEHFSFESFREMTEIVDRMEEIYAKIGVRNADC